MNLLSLFLIFLQIGLFSIGGGYAAIPLMQEQTVNVHGWLTAEEFLDLATIAEMTPGPIVINGATFAGLKVAGIPGALAATVGCVLPSLVIVSLLSWVYARWRDVPMLQNVLGSLRPAVVALIASAGINMLMQVAFGGRDMLALAHAHWPAIVLFAAAFFILRKYRWSPILVMALCGFCSLAAGLAGLI